MDARSRKRSRKCITTGKKRGSENECSQHYCQATNKQRVNGGGKLRSKIKSRSNGGGWVLDLPTHLLYDVLSKLSTGSVFSCRCVCKTFLNILVDPNFSKIARSIDRRIAILDCQALNLYIAHVGIWEQPTSSDHDHLQTLTMPLSLPQTKETTLIGIVGSCNGLLFLRYHKKGFYEEFYICNPLLGEITALPHSSTRYDDQLGFGFCSKTNQFKVIRFVDCLYCEVQTLGTNCWRRIDKAPRNSRSYGAYDGSFNGNLHWITDSKSMSDLICSFNLETEQFQYISSPTHMDFDVNRTLWMKLGKSKGLFSLRYTLGMFQYEVYVMKEYGVRESWAKVMSLDLRVIFGPKPVTPLCYLNNGDEMFRVHDISGLVYYNSQTGDTKAIMGTESLYRPIDYVPSFISLKDIPGVENVEVVQRKRLSNFYSIRGAIAPPQLGLN